MELEDFFAYYPDQNSDTIQADLTKKKELYDLRGTKEKEDLKAEGETFFKNQRIFQAMMRAYDVIINLSAPGSGKTKGYLSSSEWFKTHDTHIKRCVILSGNIQLNDIRGQLVEVSADKLYNRPSIAKAPTERSKQLNISLAISDFYTITTYHSFHNMIEREYPSDPEHIEDSNRRLIEDYSGTMFVLDETHFIRIDELAHSKKQSKKGKKKSKKGKKGPDDATERLNIYSTMWRILHLVVRSKIALITATPVTNTGTEINYFNNLVLPLNDQAYGSLMDYVVKRSGIDPKLVKYQDDTPNWLQPKKVKKELPEYVEYIHKHLNGRIMYVGEPSTEAKITYVPNIPRGVRIDDDLKQEILAERTKLLTSMKSGKYDVMNRLRLVPMQGIQLKTYLEHMQSLEVDIDDELETLVEYKKRKKDALYSSVRAIMIFVFPDGTYTIDDTKKWFTNIEGNYYISDYTYKGHNLSWWIRNKLDKMSAKFYFSVRRAYLLPGKRYVPINAVYGGGAYLYGLCLEHSSFIDPATGKEIQQFERYRPSDEEGSAEQPFEPGKKNRIRQGFKARNRYAIIHAGIKQTEIAAIFELYNHPDNWDGRYIKVIIISRIGQTGINLKETMHDDIMDAPWNPATQYQTERRVQRQNAHLRHALEYKRNGWGDVEIESNILTVVLPSTKGIPKHLRTTVDVRIHLRTEERRQRNATIMRAYKINAFDNMLNFERNALPEDMAYTPEADYQENTCEPYNDFPIGNELDMSTFNVYYIDTYIEKLQKKIEEYFSHNFISDIDTLDVNIPGYERMYFVIALQRMIDNRKSFKDMYGYQCYMRESNGLFYVTRTAHRSDPLADYTCIHYHANLIGVTKKTYQDVLGASISDNIRELVERVRSQPDKGAAFDNVVSNLSVADLISFIELAVESSVDELKSMFKMMRNTKSDKIKFQKTLLGAIMDKYYDILIFVEEEPTKHIAALSEAINSKKTNDILQLTKLTPRSEQLLSPNGTGDIVIIHYLYTLLPLKTYSGAIKRQESGNDRIRILKYSRREQEGWRDPVGIETISYRLIVEEYIRDRERMYKKTFNYYAKYTKDSDTYHIVNKLIECERAEIDKKCRRLGIMVKSISIPELLFYMYDLGIRTSLEDREVSKDVKQLRKELISRYFTSGKEPRIFNYYDLRPGSSTSLPDRIIVYMYKNSIKSGYGNVEIADKTFYSIELLRHFIAAGRIYTPGTDPMVLLQKMEKKYNMSND